MSRYDNDKRYCDYTFNDETSSFDSAGAWNGSDSYFRNYRVRIPRHLAATNDRDRINGWIEENNEKGIWR